MEADVEFSSSDIMEPKTLLNLGVGCAERVPELAAARLAGVEAAAREFWISGMFTPCLVQMGNQSR